MNRPERIAKAIVEHTIPGSTMHYRTEQTGGVHDFDLHYPDRTVAPVEVTTSTNQQINATVAAIASRRRGGRFIEARMCRNGWIVHPLADANVNRLRTDLDAFLARIETAGLTRFFSWTDASKCEPVSEILRELRIEAGSVFAWRGGRQIGIAAPGQGGRVTAEHLQHAVEIEANKADNQKKLSRTGATETHLFVYVDSRNYLPWVSLVGGPPPTKPPQLPAEITRVWVVARTRTPDEYVVWRADRDAGWTAQAPVAIHAALDRELGTV